MKISQEEIDAALSAFNAFEFAYREGMQGEAMEVAIAAALMVRKQRKAAKRERQRKEKDKQVQDSAKGEIVKPSESAIEAMYRAHGYSIPSKAPEWDGNASAFDAAMKPKA